MKFWCLKCQLSFSTRSNLNRHNKKFHKSAIESREVTESSEAAESPEEIKFASINEFHSWKENVEKETKTNYVKIHGDKHKGTETISVYYCHRRKNFKVQGSRESNCPAKMKVISSKEGCYVHFSKKHEHSTESTEEIKFASLNEFYLWKENVEKETNTNYVKVHGDKHKGTETISIYYCHRRKTFKVPVQIRKRALKAQGSCKTESNCPAKMKVIISKDGCSVHFSEKHHHEMELCHLKITKSEREELASKIKSGVNYTRIIEDARGNLHDPQQLKPLNVIRKKLLYNIAGADPNRRKFDECSIRTTIINANVLIEDSDVENNAQREKMMHLIQVLQNNVDNISDYVAVNEVLESIVSKHVNNNFNENVAAASNEPHGHELDEKRFYSMKRKRHSDSFQPNNPTVNEMLEIEEMLQGNIITHYVHDSFDHFYSL